MNAIELMLTGEMDMPEFVKLLKSDTEVQNDIRNLIPSDAIANRDHDFWKCTSFDSVEKNNFDFLMLLNWLCQFDGTLGDNLNIFGSIRRVYMYTNPQIRCTRKYSDAYDLYLDVIRDCFDGPEVTCLVEQIIQDALLIKSRKKRIEMAKKEIQKQFHTVDAQKPRWIQGPEWPMGVLSPMRFISQKRQGEIVQYLFEDTNTCETRVIEQFY